MGDREQWEEGQYGLSGTTLPWWLTVKNLPAMQETWVRSLGWKDPLEEGMAIHSSILAQGNPTDRGVWRATVYWVAKSWT